MNLVTEQNIEILENHDSYDIENFYFVVLINFLRLGEMSQRFESRVCKNSYF